MGQTKGKYTREFKEDVLRMFSSGQETGTDLERDLGLGSGMIYKWRKQLQQEEREGLRAFPGNGNARDEELARLRKELANVTEERDILRKAVGISSKTKDGYTSVASSVSQAGRLSVGQSGTE